jgi:hypothetical protein
MMSEEYAINPFGVDFVPEEMEEKLNAGVPVKELTKRANIGHREISSVPLAQR